MVLLAAAAAAAPGFGWSRLIALGIAAAVFGLAVNARRLVGMIHIPAPLSRWAARVSEFSQVGDSEGDDDLEDADGSEGDDDLGSTGYRVLRRRDGTWRYRPKRDS